MVTPSCSHRIWGIALAIPLTLAMTACSEAAPITSNDLESIIQESEAQDHARTQKLDDLTIACMARNGFDYSGPNREAFDIDLAPGLELEEQLAMIGSSAVATEIWMIDEGNDLLAAMEGSSETHRSQLGEAEWTALHETATVDGTAIEGGCVRWAETEYVRLHPEYPARVDLNDAYGTYMVAADEDPRVADIHDTWSVCMTGEGFDGYHEIGDQHADIQRRIEALYAQNPEASDVRAELLVLQQFDIEVSQAAYRCWNLVEADRQAVLDEYARDFNDLHSDDIAELRRLTGS